MGEAGEGMEGFWSMPDMERHDWGFRMVVQMGSTQVDLLEFVLPGSFHSHDDEYEVAACVGGSGVVETEKGEEPMEAGMISAVPPGVEHRMVPKKGERYHWVVWYQEEKPFAKQHGRPPISSWPTGLGDGG